ncbi:MAG: biotin/lipoyl-binding protein [Gammaproteobacteria bacterium]|nr:biotin/lipoyl-binding protein [Gammaproteobacteria bacterium]
MEALTLPELRDDLELLPGPRAVDGSPTWSIFDPPRNRYFRIGWLAFEMLARWSTTNSERLIARVRAETGLDATRRDVEALIRFLWANSLTRRSPSGSNRDYLQQHAAARGKLSQWLIHRYLFFRIPLVRPDRFLDATRRWVEPLYGRAFALVTVIVGLLGLYLATRQWDEFVHTFLYFFNFQSLVFYAVALVVIKAFHELGHAYTAKRYGCRVPTMGLAFLVLFPVLYTDATDAWRLTSRRQRAHIAAAGMLTELGIAAFATCAWAILPDGALRSVAFFAATTSWVLSLLINLNPLMRFDGYYLLSDVTGIENLQERSFRFGRWRLRRLLFGARDPAPETVAAGTARFLTWFAWATWVYRFFLFLGIALLVYFLFFKLLGLILFVTEITWFILMPIARELAAWWSRRRDYFATRQFLRTSLLLLSALGLFFVPWQETTRFPGVLEYVQRATVYPHEAGRVVSVSVKEGDRVRRGDAIARLESPEVEHALRMEAERVRILELRIARTAASADELAWLNVLYEELDRTRAALKSYQDRREKLTLRASLNGQILDLADALHPGRWVNPRLAVAFIAATDAVYVKGYLEESKLVGVMVGAEAEFVPDDPLRPTVVARIVDVEQAGDGQFDEPYLASVYGGDIAVREDTDGRLVSEQSIYKVRLLPDDAVPPPGQVVTGAVRARGTPLSLFDRLYRQIAAVIIRETGF